MPEWLTALVVTLIALAATLVARRAIYKLVGGLFTLILGVYTLSEAFKDPQVVVWLSISLILICGGLILFVIYKMNKQDKEKAKRAAEGGTTINIHPPR